MNNPFEIIEKRLSNIESLVLDALHPSRVEKRENKQNQPFIKGIHELAKFLRCSPSRAQKLKNEGRIPFFQDGRTVLFDPDKVREVMQIVEQKKGLKS